MRRHRQLRGIIIHLSLVCPARGMRAGERASENGYSHCPHHMRRPHKERRRRRIEGGPPAIWSRSWVQPSRYLVKIKVDKIARSSDINRVDRRNRARFVNSLDVIKSECDWLNIFTGIVLYDNVAKTSGPTRVPTNKRHPLFG